MKDLSRYIQEFLEDVEIARGRSARTVRNYHDYLTRFAQWAGNPAPSTIDAEMIRKFRLFLNREVPGRQPGEMLKKSTQNYHLIALRAFLKYLAKRDVPTLAPEKVELAKQGSRDVGFLEPEELARLLAVPRKDPLLTGVRDTAILELLFSTGLRVSEAAGLKIEHVRADRDEFTVLGKGGKHRVVFLSPAAKAAIAAYLERRRDTSPFLFVRHDRAGGGATESHPLTPRSVQRIVDNCAREAGITKHVSPHMLRHTYATDLLRNGADIRSVQALLGHASITTTQVYTHVTDQQLKGVHERFHGKGRPSA